MRIYNWHGFVVTDELEIPPNGAVQLEYRRDGRWLPACVFPNLTEEELQSPCNDQDWNWATQYHGLVHGYQIRDRRVYWNYIANFNGIPENREQELRIRQCGAGGKILTEEIVKVVIDPGDTVILNDWSKWSNVRPEVQTVENWRIHDPSDVEPGWYVIQDEFGAPRLSGFGAGDIGAVECYPKLSGRYDCYVGFREQVLECIIEFPGELPTALYLHPSNMPTTRFTKEIRVGNYEFHPDDPVRIRRRPNAARGKLRRFGDMLYLKFVPAAPKKPAVPAFFPPKGEIVFYAEPYSQCYGHSLQNEEAAEAAAKTYRSFGVDKVIAQTGRVGSRMMHYSRIAGFISDTVAGDDRRSSNGVMEAMRRMDVMKVLGAACRRNGMKFLADIGVNSPYVNSTLCSEWTAEHMDCLHPLCPLFLDYEREEVREFAAENFAEVIREYDFDGISVNYTRNFVSGMTAENIVDLHRRIVARIGPERRREQEINVSIIAGHPEIYRALETLLAEKLIDTLTVGNYISLYPVVDLAPWRALLDRYSGGKLYGKIDGWTLNHTGAGQKMFPRPAECARAAADYFAKGADGLYFYQSEFILADPFMRNFVLSLKGGGK